MSHPARLAVVENRIEKCEQDIASLPAHFDSLDKRLRKVELILAGGLGALGLLQIIGLLT